MKTLISLFILLFSSSVFAAEGDYYTCIITNVNKSTPSGISESGIEINSRFKLDWKKDTVVIDNESVYEILVTRDQNVLAKQDLEVDFKPYVIPFSTIYLADGQFSLSIHSPDENFFTLSVFAKCDVN